MPGTSRSNGTSISRLVSEIFSDPCAPDYTSLKLARLAGGNVPDGDTAVAAKVPGGASRRYCGLKLLSGVVVVTLRLASRYSTPMAALIGPAQPCASVPETLALKSSNPLCATHQVEPDT